MTRNDIKAFGLVAALLAASTLGSPAVTAPTENRATLGYVSVPAPRTGTLMHLRGMVGRGDAILRLSGNRGCARLKLRFVAGDFGGLARNRWGDGVYLEIRSSAIVADLMRGVEVISDEVRVSTDAGDPLAEIIIHCGLRADTGFILAPGASPIRNWFRGPGRRVPCMMVQPLALGPES